jgi:arginyl-tRNA synthetase
MGKNNTDFRFVYEGEVLNSSRLVLLQALSIVIKNGMSILGVATPRSM